MSAATRSAVGAIAVATALCLATHSPARAQGPAIPDAVQAAARAASQDTARGSALRVVLLTAGTGDEVWERFGHNMLWIHDTRTGEGIAWNWGMFSFAEPGFYQRFLFGNTRYWMEGQDVGAVLDEYRARNREVVAQELALTPAQRSALDAFVRTNAQEAHRYYRYDYFLDNCSTRLRDALDFVLGGGLRASLQPRSEAGVTYRREVLRLNQHSVWLFAGMDVALGLPADAALSPWEASFVPMRLRDYLRTVSVRADDGSVVPLVASERVLVPTVRPPDPASISWPAIPLTIALAGVLLGAAIALAGRGRLRVVGVTLAAAVHGVVGIAACALWFMWLFTQHHFWAWNPHLLLATPVSLAAALVVAMQARMPGAARWTRRYLVAMAAVALTAGAAVLIVRGSFADAPAQLLAAWALALGAVHAAAAVLLSAAPAREAGPPPAAPGARAAA